MAIIIGNYENKKGITITPVNVFYNNKNVKKIIYNKNSSGKSIWAKGTYLSISTQVNRLKNWTTSRVSGSFTVNSYNLTMTNNGENATKNYNVAVCTNGIDLTGISRLTIEYTASATSIIVSAIGIVNSASNVTYNSYTKSGAISIGTHTITLDVSSLSGVYYLKMNLFGKSATVNVNEVYVS